MDTRILRIAAATLTVLASGWYIPNLVELGFHDSAYGFIIAMGLPPLLGLGLTFVKLRAGAVLIGLSSAVWAFVCVSLIVAGITLTGEGWLDGVLAVAALPVAVVGVVAAVSAFRFAQNPPRVSRA